MNKKNLICFEFLTKVITFIILLPISLVVVDSVLDGGNLNSSFLELCKLTLKNPCTYLFLIIFVLTGLYNVIGVVNIFNACNKKKNLKFNELLCLTTNRFVNLFKVENIMYFVRGLLTSIIPLLELALFILTLIKIPSFMSGVLIPKKMILTIVISLIVSVAVFFKYLYVIVSYSLNGYDFKKATRINERIMYKNTLKDTLSIIMYYILYRLFFIILFVILTFVIKNKNILYIIYILFFSLLVMFNKSFIYYFIYKKFISREKRICNIDKILRYNNNCNKFLNIIVVTSAFAIASTITILDNINYFNILFTNERITVTAHRGASSDYPENTMSAFKGAKELNADWIELDVQLTKDKELIVIHDYKTKRVTGESATVYEKNYKDLKQLNAGYIKNTNEYLPTLDEVLEYASLNNMLVNIEIKPYDNISEIVSKTIDVVNKYNYKNNIYIASQVYSVLEEVKKQDKTFKTLFVTAWFYDSIDQFKYADDFSVEASTITDELVTEVHDANKKILAWTIDDEDTIKRMIAQNVDNIITNNVKNTQELLNKNKKVSLFDKMLDKNN